MGGSGVMASSFEGYIGKGANGSARHGWNGMVDTERENKCKYPTSLGNEDISMNSKH